jgi:hypothetical protein
MRSQIKADYWYGALSIVASDDVLVGLLVVVILLDLQSIFSLGRIDVIKHFQSHKSLQLMLIVLSTRISDQSIQFH